MNFKNIWMNIKNFLNKYDFTSIMQFAFANGIIWMLMSWFYLHFINLPDSTAGGVAYSIIFAIGHLGAFSFGLWIILQLVRFCGRKAYKITAIILSTLLLFLLFADIVVYAQYRFHINIPMIGLFCSPAAFELVSFPVVMILSLIVIIAVIAAAEWGLQKISEKFKFPKSSIAFLFFIAVCFLAFNAIHAWCAFHGYRQYLIRTDALPLKYAMTATRVLMRHGYKPAAKVQSGVLGSIMKYPLKKLEFNPPAKRKNIILILVDSLRGDMFNADVMPQLFKMSEELPSVKFMQHFSGGNCTKTGVFSLFYGIPGFYFDQALRSGSGAAMIDSFIAQGYDMKIYSSGTLASPPFNRTIFTNVHDLAVSTKGSSKLDRDNRCLENFKEFLKKRDKSKPYFAFIFIDGLHGNEIPKGFDRKFKSTMTRINYLNISNDAETRNKIMVFAKDGAFYQDHVISSFLKNNKLTDSIKEDTVVIISSDHGNEFGETEMRNWGHNSNFARYQTYVPLLIFGLDRPSQTINYRTSAMDISATVMQDILGCTNDISDYSIGKNLFDPSDRPFIISSSYLETAVIHKNMVFVMTVYGIMQQYDLNGKFIKESIPPEAMKYLLSIMAKYSK